MRLTHDYISKNGIEKYYTGKMFSLEVIDDCDSTLTQLKKRAVKGEQTGLTLVSREQSVGKGRFDRTFYSPKDCGVYMSVLLRPDFPIEQAVKLTALTAVAVSEAIEKLTTQTAKIKWVNDVYISDKKVCGILTEGSFGQSKNRFDYVVLGIGVNAYPPENGFNQSISQIAAAVYATRVSDGLNRLAAEILNGIEKYYNSFEQQNFIQEYKTRSLIVGKEIQVIRNGISIPAVALNVENDCSLKVKYDNGEEERLIAGEVSLKLN